MAQPLPGRPVLSFLKKKNWRNGELLFNELRRKLDVIRWIKFSGTPTPYMELWRHSDGVSLFGARISVLSVTSPPPFLVLTKLLKFSREEWREEEK